MYKSHLLGCSFEVKGLPTPTTRNGGVNQSKLHYHTDRQRGKIHREGVSVPVLQVSYQTLPVTMEQNTHQAFLTTGTLSCACPARQLILKPSLTTGPFLVLYLLRFPVFSFSPFKYFSTNTLQFTLSLWDHHPNPPLHLTEDPLHSCNLKDF